MHESSVQQRLASVRTTFHPGIGQYIYVGWAPGLLFLFGLAVIVAALEPQAQDRLALIGVGLAITAFAGLILAYIFGMSIEIDDEHVGKVYMFGLVRASIPLQYLSASRATEHSKGWSYTRLDFKSFDDQGDGFSVYPFWVWRTRDMDRLLELARAMEAWRKSHAVPFRPKPLPSVWGFLKLVALTTWVCGLLGVVPLVIVGTRFGGWATAVVAGAAEVAIIGFAVGSTWGFPWSRSASAPANSSPPRRPDRSASSAETPDPALADVVRQVVATSEHASTRIRPARATNFQSLASDEGEQGKTAWGYVLSFVAFLMLAIGIWAATQSHAWTPLWPLNVVGGLLGYVPTVIWLAYGDRLPNRWLVLGPAAVVALILTVAIPLVVWGPVPPPPS